MSWQGSHWAKETRGHKTITDKALLIILGDYAHPETWEAHPSQVVLADDLECSKRTIQRSLDSLEERGFITTIQAGNQHQMSIYRLNGMSPAQVRAGESDNLSQATLVTGVGDTGDARSERIRTSSEGSPPENSSSSAEEEEEFLNRVSHLYFSLLPASEHFHSSVPAPGPYFHSVRANGGLPVSDLDACWEFAEAIHDAVNVGYPDHKIVTFPGVGSLPGLAACWEPVRRHSLKPQHLRLALYDFCKYDEGGPPELSPEDILERIAKRPDLFAGALTQFSLSLD